MYKLVFKANNLEKKYRGKYALKHLSMHVPEGSIYGFVGENGAGKTTTLRIITGLAFQSGGEIELLGEVEPVKVNMVRKHIGCIIENPSVYPNMTARQNLEIQRVQRKIDDKKMIQELLCLVNLHDTGKKKVKDFSLGMKQRLGLAIALLGDPKFVILDEPTNGLDPTGIIELRELIKTVNRERNITFLISSHILSELNQLATYYGFIHDGKMIEEISAEDLDKKCKKYLRIETNDARQAAEVIKEQLCYKDIEICSDKELKIYECSSKSEIVTKLLFESNLSVTSVSQQNDDLENYYINLMGVKRDD